MASAMTEPARSAIQSHQLQPQPQLSLSPTSQPSPSLKGAPHSKVNGDDAGNSQTASNGLSHGLGSPYASPPLRSVPWQLSPPLASGQELSGSQTSTPGTKTPPARHLGGNGFSSNNYFPSPQASPAHRRQSLDQRRVLSDAFPKPRRQSIAAGKRPSAVTGGYESSSDENTIGNHSGVWDETPISSSSADPRNIGPGSRAGPSSKRHRALAAQPNLPLTGHASAALAPPISWGAQGSGLLSSPITTGRRRAQSLMTPAIEYPPSTPTSRRSSRFRHPAGSPLSTRPSVSGLPQPSFERPSLQPRTTSDSAHSRSTSMRSVRTQDHDGQDDSLRTPSERRKQKMREGGQRKRTFGASLGLGTAPREALLSADQIQDLLHDVDVSSAIRRMSTIRPTAVPRRPSAQQDRRSPSPNRAAASHQHEVTTPDPIESSPTFSKPFLVSAPPALTSGDWPGRSRTASVSSSIAPTITSSRNLTPMAHGRNRTLSLATVSDTDREPMSFVQHVVSPIPAVESEEEAEDFPGFAEQADSIPTIVSDGDRRGKSPTPTPVAPAPVTAPVRSQSPPRHKDKESGRRRISGLFGIRKKREPSPAPQPSPPAAKQAALPALSPRPKNAPLLDKMTKEQEMKIAEQERREEELAQERRYRTLMQVHAHPASQRRANKAAVHFDAYYAMINDSLENPPKFNPLAVLRWVKKTDDQKVAKAKWEAEQLEAANGGHSVGVSRRGSISSPQSDAMRMSLDTSRRSIGLFGRSTTSHGEPIVAPGWHYTLDDVSAYTASGGRVDFFIPPIVELPEIPLEPPSVPPSDAGELRPRKSLSSSVGDHDLRERATSPGYNAADVSYDSGNFSSLSRTPSLDISRSTRSHQSGLSSAHAPMKPSSLQALKAPFERLGNAARRNISMGLQPTWEGELEDGRKPGWLHSEIAPSAAESTNGNPIGIRGRLPHMLSSVTGNRHDMTGTSEDEQQHGIRKLRQRTLDIISRRTHRISGPLSRAVVLRDLEEVIGIERQIRHETTASRKPTDLEIQAQEGIRAVEDEIYTEREDMLVKAKQRLDEVTLTERQMTSIISQYLAQLDQAKTMFHTAADIEISFGDLNQFRRRRHASLIAVDDESADSVAPLRGEESDRGAFSAGGNWSDGRGGRGPRRKHSLSPSPQVSPLLYSMNWTRRSTVDPTLGQAIDPIRRGELSCARAREALKDMAKAREDTTEHLQDMVETVNKLIAQKDRVRKWTTRTLDQIAQLKEERTTLRLKIRGGIRPRLSRTSDVVINLVARGFFALASVALRLMRIVSWSRQSDVSWLPWTLLLAVIAALLGYFYIAGEAVEAAS